MVIEKASGTDSFFGNCEVDMWDGLNYTSLLIIKYHSRRNTK